MQTLISEHAALDLHGHRATQTIPAGDQLLLPLRRVRDQTAETPRVPSSLKPADRFLAPEESEQFVDGSRPFGGAGATKTPAIRGALSAAAEGTRPLDVPMASGTA